MSKPLSAHHKIVNIPRAQITPPSAHRMSDEKQMARVTWRSKLTGHSGRGAWFDLATVTELVKRENKETPTHEHWVELAPPAPHR